MTAKDRLSDLEMDLNDKHVETSSLKAANMDMKAEIEELKDENGALEEEACDLLGKVNRVMIVLAAEACVRKLLVIQTGLFIDKYLLNTVV